MCLRLSSVIQANLWSTADLADMDTVLPSETEIPWRGHSESSILGADSSWHRNLMQSSSEQNGYPEDTNTHLVPHIHPTSKQKQCPSRGLVSVQPCVAHLQGNVLTEILGKR